jgi:hypothetical protein
MHALLSLLSKREAYEEFAPLVNKDSVSKEILQIVEDMGAYYKAFPARDSVSWEGLSILIKVKLHPKWSADKYVIHDSIIAEAAAYEMVPDVEWVLKKTLLEREMAIKVGEAALRIADGHGGTITDVSKLVEEWEVKAEMNKPEDTMLVTDSIEDMVRLTSASAGYKWRLPELNAALGPINKGKLVIVAARPDTGKSGFMMSEATHILLQLPKEKHLVWFNNEEEGVVVKKRIICSLLGISGDEFDANPVATKKMVEALIGDVGRIKFIDAPALDIFTISKFLKKWDAGLIVIDQLWKVHGFGKIATNEASRTTLLYGKAREWAKQYAPVMVAAQAGGEAGGEKWIGMEHIYGSKTGAQGEADAIITIGRSYDPEVRADARFINIVKNKFPHPEDEALRNGKFEVKIHPTIGRYSGYVE